MKMEERTIVFKHILANGLTVLVRRNAVVPKVSVQLWYDVGSKDEKTSEKGIAHLIEHMIFKGTKRLSESDINMITHKLSGYCNAFTSYDYTGYLFNFPTQHWDSALDLMADSMTNCTFRKEFLASEMKAVVQELKMYKDDYLSTLVEYLFGAIFQDHPYHYPIIGFKQDLWSMQHSDLLQFYQHNYVPNNATLVVVGDVHQDDVFSKAEHFFGNIPAVPYTKKTFALESDITSKSVTIYRDIEQEKVLVGWIVPGSREQKDYFSDILTWILGQGKGSILYRLLVDELRIAVDVEAFCHDCFDASVFFIYVEPTKKEYTQRIVDIIQEQIDLLKAGIPHAHIERAVNQTKSQYLMMLESNQKQAYVIGQGYLATKDAQFLFNYMQHDAVETKQEIENLLNRYFKASLMHTGFIKKIDQKDLPYWKEVQEKSEQYDARILANVKREELVEDGKYVHTIETKPYTRFNFPKPNKVMLDNGIELLYYHNPNVPMVDIVISLATKHYTDPENLQGLGLLIANAVIEGTKHFPGNSLADAIESRGMGLHIVPGQISLSMLSTDFEYGLTIIKDLLINATLSDDAIEKIKAQMLSDLHEYWDEPTSFISQLAAHEVYKNHPYSKSILGTKETIVRLTPELVREYYDAYFSLSGARIAVVGNIEHYDVPALLQKKLGCMEVKQIQKVVFPLIESTKKGIVEHPINRDQITLAFAHKTISRLDKDFDALILFEQVFTGGVLGSMSSRLFQLREASGLFYTISGSLLYHADEEPGMLFIKTIVSKDRLQEAEVAILNELRKALAHGITKAELEQAQRALINSMVDSFSANQKIASTFLYLARFGLPIDYFDVRARALEAITLEDINRVINKHLHPDDIITVRVGRVK